MKAFCLILVRVLTGPRAPWRAQAILGSLGSQFLRFLTRHRVLADAKAPPPVPSGRRGHRHPPLDASCPIRSAKTEEVQSRSPH